MPDTKISAMTAATTMADTDVLPIVAGSTNKKATRPIFLTAGAGEDIALTGAPGQIVDMIADDGDQFFSCIDATGIQCGGHSWSFVCDPASVTLFQILSGGSVTSFETAVGASTHFIVIGGGSGQLTLDYSTNTLSAQGWTFVTLQYATGSTHWQISNPADIGTALDRLAAAVDGLLGGGGIP